MFHNTLQNTVFRTLVGLSLVLATQATLASGSDGGGSAEMGDAAAYNMGKSIYAMKLACDKCPLAGKTLDAAMAKQVMDKPPVTLTMNESKALAVYMKRRFKM
jgi:hypothetical protein